MVDSEKNSRIYSNRMNYTSGDGIEVRNSEVLEIYLNTIGNCSGYGIYLYASKRVRISGNYFYYNHGSGNDYNSSHIQAYDNGNNYWNETSKGNYWQDWRGPDNNRDGIVDEPYIIEGSEGAKDYYPIAGVYVPEFTSIIIVLIVTFAALIILKKR